MGHSRAGDLGHSRLVAPVCFRREKRPLPAAGQQPGHECDVFFPVVWFSTVHARQRQLRTSRSPPPLRGVRGGARTGSTSTRLRRGGSFAAKHGSPSVRQTTRSALPAQGQSGWIPFSLLVGCSQWFLSALTCASRGAARCACRGLAGTKASVRSSSTGKSRVRVRP